MKIKKQKTRMLAIALIILGLIFLSQSTYYYYIETPINKDSTEGVSFLIKKGDSANEISKNLKEKGLIKNGFVFKLYTKQKNLAQNIIAGRFYLGEQMTIPQILQTITDPSKAELIITIQEGLTVREIDKKLLEMELIKNNDFVNAVKNFQNYEKYDFLDKETFQNLEIPLEGYLFPDTYFLDPSDQISENLITKCLNNFEQKISERPENLHEIITMASIIEKEVRTEKDLETVSGILWKRYKNNWHIGADATLIYIKDDREITKNDLETDSPYNTRKVVGIPPGPIGNPGLRSIQAALNPKESPYWYYLTTLDTGEVIYAKTNDEQNINKAKYL